MSLRQRPDSAEGEPLRRRPVRQAGGHGRAGSWQWKSGIRQIMAEYREKLETQGSGASGGYPGGGRTDRSGSGAVFADKICTDEETVRLRSHIQSARKELTQGGAVGRKLDFIAQEMNQGG